MRAMRDACNHASCSRASALAALASQCIVVLDYLLGTSLVSCVVPAHRDLSGLLPFVGYGEFGGVEMVWRGGVVRCGVIAGPIVCVLLRTDDQGHDAHL